VIEKERAYIVWDDGKHRTLVNHTYDGAATPEPGLGDLDYLRWMAAWHLKEKNPTLYPGPYLNWYKEIPVQDKRPVDAV